MKRMGASVKLCVLILACALLWRMLGAPLTAQDFRDLQTPLWQARILLPQRAARMLRLWLPATSSEAAQTMTQETGTEEPAADQTMLLVYLTQEDRLAQMTLEGYVCGVVAAEMPAQYHLEALKAQAVAARTRAMWQKEQGGCELHPGADICTDSAHCQGYASAAAAGATAMRPTVTALCRRKGKRRDSGSPMRTNPSPYCTMPSAQAERRMRKRFLLKACHTW